MRASLVISAFVFPFLLIGCSKDLTEVVVSIDTNIALPTAMDEIEVVVRGSDETESFRETKTVDTSTVLPLTLSLTPNASNDSSFSVVANGSLTGTIVVSQTVSASFVPGQRRVLVLTLEASCVNVSCMQTETCKAGVCAPTSTQTLALPEGANADHPLVRPLADAGTDSGPTVECTQATDCTARSNTNRSCDNGTCTYQCTTGSADCDDNVLNGCEQDTVSSANHCGGCGISCSGGANVSSSSCVASGCILSCASGFSDCDHDTSNGCEANLLRSTSHCGQCNQTCGFLCESGNCSETTEVHAGGGHTCAALNSGKLFCWGNNFNSELGTSTSGSTSPTPIETPMPAVGGSPAVTHVSTGRNYTCAINSDGKLYCWGATANGVLGIGTTSSSSIATPTLVTPLPATLVVAAGVHHTCALSTSGEVRCWGSNTNGQLGTGNTIGLDSPPAQAVALGAVATDIQVGEFHTCARLNNASVMCWGINSAGQLGNTSTSQSLIPVAVSSSDTLSRLSLGFAHSCVRAYLSGDNALECWGSHDSGALGNGLTGGFTISPATVNPSTPPGTGVFNHVVDVSAGQAHTCAIRTEAGTSADRLYCFGDGTYGQLGNGTTDQQTSPVLVTTFAAGVTSVSAGSNHTCAEVAIGTHTYLYCWGSNSRGQVGNGSSVDVLVPTAITVPE